MADREIVNEIIKLAGGGRFEFEGDRCVTADLTDSSSTFHGIIRHNQAQEAILRLVARLEGLKYLDLRKNRLRHTPPEMANLTQLLHLDLSSNYLGELPAWVSRARGLKFLAAGVNGIKEVPPFLGELTELETLKLHKNNVRQFHLPSLKKLRFLNLYLNNIQRLPYCIFSYKSLEFFSWGVSGVSMLPDRIGEWSRLKYLSLVGNKLEELPDSFCCLTSLIGVRLHKNRLKRLPERIGSLQALEQLTLCQNELKSLPDSFAQLGALRKLNLEQNRFPEKPSQIAGIKLEWFVM